MRFRMMPFLLLLAPAAALAQPPSKVLVATGKEVQSGLPSPGTAVCEGGQPLNDPNGPPCSPGTKRIWIWNRNSTFQYQQVSGPAAELMQGSNSVIAHCNLDGSYYGHCWGTFSMSVSGAGGYWEGTWSGMYDMLTNNFSYSASAFGYGGKLEGLQMKYEAASTGPGPTIFIVKISGV